MGGDIKSLFTEVYTKFKLQFYRKIFTRFAEFVNISPANAAYKIQCLVKKGYVEKIQSETDRREYHLKVTEKFHEYNRLSVGYVEAVVDRMQDRFTKEELATFTYMLSVISEELTPEISIRDYRKELPE